jgi:hypothetical protein
MLNRDFKESAEWLHAKGADCLVAGGCALAAHGHPRDTGFKAHKRASGRPQDLADLEALDPPQGGHAQGNAGQAGRVNGRAGTTPSEAERIPHTR